MDFVSQLNAVVEKLKSDPAIHVAHYLVLPPDEDAIKEVENELGYALDASITDFYKTCGGIQLLWLFRDDEAFDMKKEAIEKELEETPVLDFNMFEGELGLNHTFDITADEIITDGVILIPPIKTCFLDQEYNGNSDEYGIEPEVFEPYGVFQHTEDIKIRRFDMFDTCVNTAFILDGNSNPVLLTATDKYEYDYSAIITFKDYLVLLIASAGNRRRGHDFLLTKENRYKTIAAADIAAFTSK